MQTRAMITFRAKIAILIGYANLVK